MIYGYFIAKVKDNNLSFLLKRFNEKYPQKSNLHIKFFDETPLTIRRIRYNQNGPICYCMQDTNIGRQKSSNIWKEITCSEDCEYRTRAKDGSKPLCNLEATLKFILPEISTDRVWLMKITGYTSIKRLNGYINLQKQLGYSLIGDYYLFLKKEKQTTTLGKSFNNFILDIIRKENFSSNYSLPSSQASIPQSKIATTPKKISQLDYNANQPTTNLEKESKYSKSNIIKTPKENIKSDKFANYYFLLDLSNKTITFHQKSEDCLIGTFVDQNDNKIDAIIPEQFKEEILNCDAGTIVMLDLITNNNYTYASNIKFIQKCLKNVVA